MYGQIYPFAFRSFLGLRPRELLQEKGYIWPYIPTLVPEYYGCSRQCGRPVGALCSMGIGQNPIINGLFQHTFKLNLLFVEIVEIFYLLEL